MRLKDERLRPCYNVMIGTENQFILNYTLHQKSTESEFLIEHLQGLKALPQKIVGDAAFGSEQNYAYLEQKGIKNYLKYTHFFQESKRSFKKKVFNKKNFRYLSQKDRYICPNERELLFIEERISYNAQKYPSLVRIYKSETCEDCSMATLCKRGQGARQIQFSPRFEYFKNQAKTNLNSELGFKLRKERNTDVETVFGNIKHNLGFDRFNLRGFEKVKLEFGLVAMAHNFRKMTQLLGGYPLLTVFFLFTNLVLNIRYLKKEH